ncbi:hypothetical protein DL766_009608 [Monosporascus sp. MC13-8B]|uniref:Uncharacterized protein n=1 Tax=Monosporascus cannonballus TaxID=155416 RepID=A0ABY0GRN7_9PEZI|nr:hypothetical protein DL762_010218 [Monosporascus cannonballus]RYO85047.1 hypothetical protein DL763_007252 [Monosporascus cannonballus]RYP14673.1 hypothetical protein DL766_009608 [Monosporascus sp. MC13-8B]
MASRGGAADRTIMTGGGGVVKAKQLHCMARVEVRRPGPSTSRAYYAVPYIGRRPSGLAIRARLGAARRQINGRDEFSGRPSQPCSAGKGERERRYANFCNPRTEQTQLHSQLARLSANLADTENLLRMTSVQAEAMRGLGSWHGGLFMAASKVLGEESVKEQAQPQGGSRP